MIRKIPKYVSSISSSQDDEEDVSYNVESLFTTIPIKETVSYIIE